MGEAASSCAAYNQVSTEDSTKSKYAYCLYVYRQALALESYLETESKHCREDRRMLRAIQERKLWTISQAVVRGL